VGENGVIYSVEYWDNTERTEDSHHIVDIPEKVKILYNRLGKKIIALQNCLAGKGKDMDIYYCKPKN
jgi:hypothetical protein